MTGSACIVCDVAAARYWGQRPLCLVHYAEERASEPLSHLCPKCSVEQPPAVSWRRDRPCATCQDGMARDTAAYDRRGRPKGSPAPVDAKASVSDALVACRLFEGFPDAREATAAQLVREAVSASQVRSLGDWADRTFGRTKKRHENLSAILRDPERRAEILADIDSYATRKLAPGESERATPSDPTEWDEIDRARRMSGRVDGDGKTLEQAASEFGFEPSEAARLLKIGRELRAVRS